MKPITAICMLVIVFSTAACGAEPTPIVVVEPTDILVPMTAATESIPTAAAVTGEAGGSQTATPPAAAQPSNTAALAVTAGSVIERQDEREEMVERGVHGWGVQDDTVLSAMFRVPRHEFVPKEYASQAYENHPLPIGYGQTISQPYIVGLMTEAIDPSPEYRVLEIGTGSGYQAAVLAELVDQVYSIEIIGPLHERARETLSRLGYDNISLLHADGYYGWEEYAPFDAIVVTAAPDHVPQPLIQQLKVGGKMIIPVGPVGGFQNLWLINKTGENKLEIEDLGGVSFVPFTREE